MPNDPTKKCICYFVGTHGDWGGSSRIIFNIVRHIDRRRVEPIMMLTAAGEASESLAEQGIRYEIWQHEERYKPFAHVRQLARAFLFLRRNRVDIVSLAYGCLGWRPAELLAARLAAVPIVQHCQQVIRSPSPYTRYSSLILTCSEFVARESAFAPVPTMRLYDIVDTSRFGAPRNIRRELELDAAHFVITFLGRKRRSKGLEVFAALARAFPQEHVRFLVATQRTGKPNADSYSDSEFDALLAGDPRIRYVGYRPDVENIYAASDLIVMPSQADEPCPAVALEAAASGKPIVATDTGATRELIVDGETGFLVPKTDFEALMDKVRLLMCDPQRRADMKTKATTFAREQFREKPIEQLHRIYASL